MLYKAFKCCIQKQPKSVKVNYCKLCSSTKNQCILDFNANKTTAAWQDMNFYLQANHCECTNYAPSSILVSGLHVQTCFLVMTSPTFSGTFCKMFQVEVSICSFSLQVHKALLSGSVKQTVSKWS